MTRSEALAGVALAFGLVGPAAWRGRLAGSAGAEVYGHAWVQGWAAGGWPAWPSGTDLAEGTATWAVIDPLYTWSLGGLARLVGPVVAWNLGVAGAIVLAAVGGGALARAAGGAGLVGAVGLATAPIFLGSLTSGLTEDYALGLLALALAALLRGRPIVGGALLGASAMFGLYLAWLGAWVALPLGLWKGGARGHRWRWLLGGLLALALVLPAAAPFRARLAGEGHRTSRPPARHEPLWRLDPWRGADVASLLAPGKVDTGGALVREHPVYLGYTTLALAAAGGWHPAWLAVAACVAVAPGEELSVAGEPTGRANPAMWLFHRLPFAERFNHHARVMLLGQMLLVMLAARGASGRPRLAALLLLAETALLSPARMPLPGASAESPAIYAALGALPAGPVSVRGAAGPGIHPQKVFFDQRAHGRALLHNPNRPLDGRPRPGSVFVVLGGARPAELGEPAVQTADGAAWWVAR